jgi:hypothetical protein
VTNGNPAGVLDSLRGALVSMRNFDENFFPSLIEVQRALAFDLKRQTLQ